jgi:hypothetical protein
MYIFKFNLCKNKLIKGLTVKDPGRNVKVNWFGKNKKKIILISKACYYTNSNIPLGKQGIVLPHYIQLFLKKPS